MKPEELAEKLHAAWPEGLMSVILYGSAAAGDFVEKRSDYNVLVVGEPLGLGELKAMAPPVRAWLKAGNPPPLCFTWERLKRSADVFPMELLDIQENHRVIYGRDVITAIKVSRTNLRHELEYELRSKLIQLQAGYFQAEGDPKQVAALMINSLSSFLTLFRGALRLFEKTAPAAKLDALRILSDHLGFPAGVFEQIHELKIGPVNLKKLDLDDLFQRYLQKIGLVIDAVDRGSDPAISPRVD